MTDDAAWSLFLPVARRRRQERVDALLDEVDRLTDLDGLDLLQLEPVQLERSDPDFNRALRVATWLLYNVRPEDVDVVRLRASPYTDSVELLVAQAHGGLELTGPGQRVERHAFIEAWRRAGQDS